MEPIDDLLKLIGANSDKIAQLIDAAKDYKKIEEQNELKIELKEDEIAALRRKEQALFQQQQQLPGMTLPGGNGNGTTTNGLSTTEIVLIAAGGVLAVGVAAYFLLRR